jgi:rfaE bifunctional protein nucleotidyltransferase chain/domain
LGFHSKIKSPDQLARLIKKSKNKYVFTNGCFDLLHKGHVTYLEQARKLGAGLIVALNSDNSVRRLKGEGRPLNTLADRMDVMAALESVDYVTWFDADTPLELIRKLRPKVLVKGGDWRADQIVGGPDVISWGGKVKSLPYVEGKSTTQLIEKVRKK